VIKAARHKSRDVMSQLMRYTWKLFQRSLSSLSSMVARSILARRLRHPGTQRVLFRVASTAQAPQKIPEKPSTAPTSTTQYKHSKPPPRRSWLTEKVRASPAARSFFLGLATVLGYNSRKQVAARRSLALYERVCVVKADEEREFWIQGTLTSRLTVLYELSEKADHFHEKTVVCHRRSSRGSP
jgi:hypothetical protein